MNFKVFDIGSSFIKIYDSNSKEIIRIEQFSQNIISLASLKNIINENINETTNRKTYLRSEPGESPKENFTRSGGKISVLGFNKEHMNNRISKMG